MRILPTAFSLEHIPKVLAPSGTLRSAPRDFKVYVRERRRQQNDAAEFLFNTEQFFLFVCFQGLDDESQERGTLLGTYSYDKDGDALQTFPVSVSTDCTGFLLLHANNVKEVCGTENVFSDFKCGI